MVEKTAKTITKDPKILYKPKESGPNRRVTMGVRRRLTNCEMIGTEDSVSTSWTKEFEDFIYK